MKIDDLISYVVIYLLSALFFWILATLALPGWQLFAGLIVLVDMLTPAIQHASEAMDLAASVM